MECNKDEAVRVKALAEQKLQDGDFTLSQKFALKAQKLYPDLENLSQLLTVCNVHCSAQIKVNGAEMDWYGILQVEKFSDEAVIKKQFRKLALFLHPDKNNLAGAEAAFKLISEAHMVLTDPTKRALYDMKCKGSARPVIPKPAGSNQWSRNSNLAAQQRVANKFPGAFDAPKTGSSPSQQQPTFWTSCPSCNVKFQYFRELVGRMLRCQNCQQNFVAHDLGSDFKPSGTTFPPSRFANQNGNVNQGPPKVAPQRDGGNLFGTTLPKAGKFFNVGKPEDSKVGNFSEVGGSFKAQEKSNGRGRMKEGERDVSMQNFDASKSKKLHKKGGANRKRGRKSFVDANSSDGSDDELGMHERGSNVSARTSGPSEGYQPRKSSRQKKQVSYNEHASDDDDNARLPSKKLKGNGLSASSAEEMTEIGVDIGVPKGRYFDGSSASVHENKEEVGVLNESISDEKGDCRATAGLQASLRRTDSDVRNERGRMEVESRSILSKASEGQNIDFLEPEFSNFDEFRDEKCFAVNQVWAIYDPVDGMPRYYARIRKVFSSGFKLRITWFETCPDDEKEQAWCDGNLPVSCGKYETGGTEDTQDRLMFSHQICLTCVPRGRFSIYPQKGETWAIFKSWSIEWSSEPEKHGPPYQFEIVEILSNFDEDMGIGVSYLEKVKGFVSIFKQAADTGNVSSYIHPSEIYKFSHQIPSVKLTGKEGNGVPEGALELDTASLPVDLQKAGDAVKDGCSKWESGGKVGQSKGIGPSSLIDQEKKTPKKRVNGELVQDGLNHRRSPRDISQKNGQASAGKLSEKISSWNVAANSDGNDSQVAASTGQSAMSPSSRCGPVLEVVPYDFRMEKSEDRFQVGQVWALFSSKDGMPKDFAVIKKIDAAPIFRVHVAELESCLQEDINRPSACGIFQVNCFEIGVQSLASFSHRLMVDSCGKNKYNIFPRKGEIWAIYKNGNPHSTSSCEDGDECDFVEVLEGSDLVAKVAMLTQINGYDRFFWAPRTQTLRGDIVEIPCSEFARFSHRCCAFWHTGEKESPSKGFWEIDSSSMPGGVILLD